MSFFGKLEYFWKQEKKDKLQNISDKLPENEVICKEILADIGNEHTKLKLDNQIKNSYYIYLNDTIYLADIKKVREFYTRVIIISHECRHTIQSKLLQKTNFILSNIELILFALFAILGMFKLLNIPMIISFFGIALLSIIIRSILEIDAVLSSTKITKKYMDKKITKEEAKFYYDIVSFQIKLLLPFSIITLFIGKFFRMLLILVMYIFIK